MELSCFSDGRPDPRIIERLLPLFVLKAENKNRKALSLAVAKAF
jgi:hypothetical protein